MTDSEEREDRKTNGTSGPYDQWYSVQQAAALLELSPRRVYAMIEAGDLSSKNDSRGKMRIPPDEVQAIAPAGTSNEAQKNQTETIKILQSLVRGQQEGQASYLKLIPDATIALLEQSKKVIEFQSTVIADLHEENRKLRTERTEMLRMHEHALSEAHERELRRDEMLRKQARLDKGAEQLLQLGPRMLEQYLMGADVQKLLGSLDPDLLTALTSEASPLTPEQRVWVASIRDRIVSKRPDVLPPKSPEETSEKEAAE